MALNKPINGKAEECRVKNPVVLADEWGRMMASGKYRSKTELGKAVGVSHTWVRKIIKLNRLCDVVREVLIAIGDEVPRGLLPVEKLEALTEHRPARQKTEIKILLAAHGIYPMRLR